MQQADEADSTFADVPQACGIYQIRHIESGKVYVGSAVNLRKRWREHRSTLRRDRHFNRYLQRAWMRAGETAFRFEVIEFCEAGDLIAREQWHIDRTGSANPSKGFNLRPNAASQLGFKMPPEAVEKVASAKRGKKQSPDWVSARTEGRRAARETRGGPSDAEKRAIEARAAKRKGQPQPQHVVELHRARLSGVKQSPELVAKRVAGRRAAREARGGMSEAERAHLDRLAKAKIGRPRPDVQEWAPRKFARFTPEQAGEIRRLRAAGVTQKSLAERYGCSQATISFVINRRGVQYK